MSFYPRCFESQAEYQVWREHARLAPPAPFAMFCEDCTPMYQRRMKDEGRCENPSVKFDWINDSITGLDARDYHRRTEQAIKEARGA